MSTTTTPYDIVPFVAQEKRFDGKMIIWTARSNKSDRINAWFGHLERELTSLPEDALLFVGFDFASFKLSSPAYFRQRLLKLAELGAGGFQGRIAVAQRLSLGHLLSGNGWTSEVSAAFPRMEVAGFNDRDAAIGWLVSGYEQRVVRR